MTNKMQINVGLEVAKFLYRQATDYRVRGIYCGGYITKFLKGFQIFQPPASDDPGVESTLITDGPFPSWGLVKLIDQTTPSRYSTPSRGVSSPFAASTSRSPSLESTLHQLRNDFKEERQLNLRERRKNKHFRASVWAFLSQLASCFSPPPSDLPTYETSPEPPSSDDAPTAPRRREGKAPAEPAPESSSEELDKGEEADEGEEADDNAEDDPESSTEEADEADDDDDNAEDDPESSTDEADEVDEVGATASATDDDASDAEDDNGDQ